MKKTKEELGKEPQTKEKKKGVKFIVPAVLIIIIIIIVFVIQNKGSKISVNVKSSLDRIVEKSNLETINITYNVIAKQCKDSDDCDKKSNNIDDFEYVVSCKGTITAGIDFKKIEIDEDSKNKVIIISMPEATIIGDPTIGSLKFLNGEDVPADELPNARKLCQETTKIKSEEDGKLLPAAKEQARTVLEEYYKQWIKTYDSSYKVEIR